MSNEDQDRVLFSLSGTSQIRSALGQREAFEQPITDVRNSIAPEHLGVQNRIPIHESPEFRNWFEGSKVVDAMGAPIVLYHGTASRFDVFDAKRYGTHFTGDYGVGFYFTQNSDSALRYAQFAEEIARDEGRDDAAHVVPVYLNLKNPLIVKRAFGDGDLWAQVPGAKTRQELTDGLRALGYDGVIVNDGPSGHLYVHEAVAFYPEQIKSARNNNGVFNPNDPRITHSIAIGQTKAANVTRLYQTLMNTEFGSIVERLIDQGSIVLHDSIRDVLPNAPVSAQAFTYADGTIHLGANALDNDNAVAVLLHEVFHSHVRPFIGNRQWKALQARLKVLYDEARTSDGEMGRFWRQAANRVDHARNQGSVRSEDVAVEEFGAYAIEHYEQAPGKIKRWVSNCAGTVKGWFVRRFGLQLGNVTPGQLRSLAAGALRASAKNHDGQRDIPIPEPVFSAQADVTQRPQFRAWFGKSKITNEAGEPLVLYHGTNKDFDTFDADRSREDEKAIFATDSPEIASDFAIYRTTWEGANVMPIYVRAEKVLEIDGNYEPIRDVENNFRHEGMKEGESLRSYAMREGYEAVIIRNTEDAVGPDIVPFSDVYMLLPGSQIKSAIGNKGDFSPENPDIRFSLASDESAKQLVDVDSLSDHEKEDLITALQAGRSKSFDDAKQSHGEFEDYELEQNIFGLTDPLMVLRTTLNVADIDAEQRAVSEHAVNQYAQLDTRAPAILVSHTGAGYKLVEGGHRLAAAKQKGQSFIDALDVTDIMNMDWDAYLNGETSPDMPLSSNVFDEAKTEHSNFESWLHDTDSCFQNLVSKAKSLAAPKKTEEAPALQLKPTAKEPQKESPISYQPAPVQRFRA